MAIRSRVPTYQIRCISYDGEHLGEVLAAMALKQELANSSSDKSEFVLVKSDLNGHISLQGVEGRSLRLKFLKAGYLEPRQKSHFSFAQSGSPRDHSPDPNSPVFFQMWKLGGGQTELVEKEIKVKVSGDNVKHYVNLTDGRVVEESKVAQVPTAPQPNPLGFGTYIPASIEDFDLSFQIHIDDSAGQKRTYPWSFNITMRQGGLRQTDDLYLFTAPESDYQGQFQYDMQAAGPSWSSSPHKSFYVTSRAG